MNFFGDIVIPLCWIIAGLFSSRVFVQIISGFQNPNILVTFSTSFDKHTENKGLHHLIASAVFI